MLSSLKTIFLLTIISFTPSIASPETTTPISWRHIKLILDEQIYYDHRSTIYCEATFNQKREVSLPHGFITTKHIAFARSIDWEHIVPAQNFGRTFKEWREGHPKCVKNNKPFKNRDCAELTNFDYQKMQVDMHNIYPAIASVNRLRSNYNFRLLPNRKSDFGSCEMKVFDRKAEPPIRSRGQISRAYLHMDKSYKNYNMSNQQKQLMNAWNKLYPANPWECERAERIDSFQEQKNTFVSASCKKASVQTNSN